MTDLVKDFLNETKKIELGLALDADNIKVGDTISFQTNNNTNITGQLSKIQTSLHESNLVDMIIMEDGRKFYATEINASTFIKG